MLDKRTIEVVQQIRRLVILTNVPTPYRIPFFNSLYEALARQLIHLHVLFCASHEPNRHWVIPFDQQQYEWSVLPGLHPSLPGIYPHVNPAVVPRLRKLKPTWILSAGAWNTPTMLLASQRWLAGPAIRLFWSEGHADAVLHAQGLIATLRRSALRSYDAFAVPNVRSADFIHQELDKDRPILRLPNTIDEDFFDVAAALDRAAARNKFRFPEEAVVIVTVAQLESRKGVLEMAEAYDQLPEEDRSRLILVFAGEGTLHDELVRKAQHSDQHIRLLGHLDQVNIRDLLAASDAFMLPSKIDPNPISLIEAAFMGLPLLASEQVGNVHDLVVHNENGYILKRGTAEQVSSAFRWLLALSGNERQYMGKYSQQVAQKNFRRSNVARDFVQELLTTFPSKSDEG